MRTFKRIVASIVMAGAVLGFASSANALTQINQTGQYGAVDIALPGYVWSSASARTYCTTKSATAGVIDTYLYGNTTTNTQTTVTNQYVYARAWVADWNGSAWVNSRWVNNGAFVKDWASAGGIGYFGATLHTGQISVGAGYHLVGYEVYWQDVSTSLLVAHRYYQGSAGEYVQNQAAVSSPYCKV